MKKIALSLLAVLALYGIAHAADITVTVSFSQEIEERDAQLVRVGLDHAYPGNSWTLNQYFTAYAKQKCVARYKELKRQGEHFQRLEKQEAYKNLLVDGLPPAE